MKVSFLRSLEVPGSAFLTHAGLWSADRQAELPNTAIVKSGPIEIIKAPHGLRREIFITDVHIAGYTEHSYTTGPFGTVHHWDCTVSVSYSGIGYYIPEGAILEIFTVNVTAQALRDELRRVSGR